VFWEYVNFDFFNTIRKSDRTEALEKIIDGGYPRRSLFLVSALASGIAAIGLITDDVVLIIGSMIVAPLLLPLLSLGLGFALFDPRLTYESSKTVVFGALVSVLFVLPLAYLLGNIAYLEPGSYYLSIQPSLESSLVAKDTGRVPCCYDLGPATQARVQYRH
jgi:hypothetical protein